MACAIDGRPSARLAAAGIADGTPEPATARRCAVHALWVAFFAAGCSSAAGSETDADDGEPNASEAVDEASERDDASETLDTADETMEADETFDTLHDASDADEAADIIDETTDVEGTDDARAEGSDVSEASDTIGETMDAEETMDASTDAFGTDSDVGACLDVHATCTTAADCCPGLACQIENSVWPEDRVCCRFAPVGPPPFAPCTRDDDCCGFMICEYGYCQCRVDGEECVSSEECCYGECRGGVCLR